MKAAIVEEAGSAPVYGELPAPTASGDQVVVNVTAAAVTNLTKMRAAGTHYSTTNTFPFVPGFDGVGTLASGERVFFQNPEQKYGSFAEQALVRKDRTRPIPDSLDDQTAAAIANPGMSAYASMVHRGQLQKGDTVLINGATGTAGKLCVQLAKILGAGKVIATARNAKELENVKTLGADVTLAFNLPGDEDKFKNELVAQYKQKDGKGIDVIIDYLYGPSTSVILNALPGTLVEGHQVRYVNVGTAAKVDEIPIAASLLRSTPIEIMGSGLVTVPEQVLLDSIAEVFKVANKIKQSDDDLTMPLADISKAWAQKGAKPRIVLTMK